MENEITAYNKAMKTRKRLYIALAVMWAVIILVGVATAVLLIISNVRLPGLM